MSCRFFRAPCHARATDPGTVPWREEFVGRSRRASVVSHAGAAAERVTAVRVPDVNLVAAARAALAHDHCTNVETNLCIFSSTGVL